MANGTVCKISEERACYVPSTVGTLGHRNLRELAKHKVLKQWVPPPLLTPPQRGQFPFLSDLLRTCPAPFPPSRSHSHLQPPGVSRASSSGLPARVGGHLRTSQPVKGGLENQLGPDAGVSELLTVQGEACWEGKQPINPETILCRRKSLCHPLSLKQLAKPRAPTHRYHRAASSCLSFPWGKP